MVELSYKGFLAEGCGLAGDVGVRRQRRAQWPVNDLMVKGM